MWELLSEVLRQYGLVIFLIAILGFLFTASGWVVAYFVYRHLNITIENFRKERSAIIESFKQEREEMRKETVAMHVQSTEVFRDVHSIISECVTLIRDRK